MFQHVSPMSISRKVFEAIKIKVSNCKNIYKYTNAYQEALDDVYSLTTKDSEWTTKRGSMILQAALLTNMGPESAGMVCMIEAKWKNGTTNLENTILRLVKFKEIRKGNFKAKEQPSQPTILFSSSSSTNPYNLQPHKGTCTDSDYVKRGITSYFI